MLRASTAFFTAMLVVCSLVATPTAAAQDFSADPVRAFAGCDTQITAPSDTATPRDRISQPSAPSVDKVTQRAFASLSLEDIEAGVPAGMPSLCWARLDGVWREIGQVVLDKSQQGAGVWGSNAPELLALANGTYTTPRHIVIVEPKDPNSALYLATGLTGTPFVKFVSTDNIALKDVLKRGGARKTYTATGNFQYGSQMVIDVTRTGRVRLLLNHRTYIRPQPGVSKTAEAGNISSDDAFLLSYNLENLAASRRGYDVVTQDPFYLLHNPKLEVFAKVDPKNYYITEKRTVPLGFSLVQEGSQGMVFRKSLVSTEQEMQETMAVSFGAKVGTADGSLSPYKSKVGFNFATSAMKSMTQSNSVAEAIGYSRSKQYALVVDEPYITLSNDFIDAIEDARRFNKYQAVIDKFGTHYAYAVTYGAAAKITQSFTEKSYSERAEHDSEFNAEGGTSVMGVGGEIQGGMKSGTASGTSGTIGKEGATFVAVGGNGSWDQNGYSAGNTPYPVLLDLRPLDELLNPMNFPGEPQVYDTVRRNLKRAIAGYLARSGRPLSTRSSLPEVKPFTPEPVEVWHVYVRQIWCTGLLSGRARSASAESLTIKATGGAGNASTMKTNGLKVPCKARAKPKKFSYGVPSPGLLVLKGTRQQLLGVTLKFNVSWNYHPGFTTRHDEKFIAGGLNGVAVGKSKDVIWTLDAVSLPDFKLRLRIKHIK